MADSHDVHQLHDPSPEEPLIPADLRALAKALTPADHSLDEPPADLWGRIADAVEASAPIADLPTPLVTVRRARHRPSWRRPLLVLAVAASLIAALSVGVSQRNRPTIVAEVALSNRGLDQEGRVSAGRARLVAVDGHRAIELDLQGLPSEESAYLELWLIDSNVEGMVSLGPITGSGTYRVPDNVAVRAFPVVDVSIEPVDGKPTHSGRSLLRGVLPT